MAYDTAITLRGCRSDSFSLRSVGYMYTNDPCTCSQWSQGARRNLGKGIIKEE